MCGFRKHVLWRVSNLQLESACAGITPHCLARFHRLSQRAIPDCHAYGSDHKTAHAPLRLTQRSQTPPAASRARKHRELRNAKARNSLCKQPGRLRAAAERQSYGRKRARRQPAGSEQLLAVLRVERALQRVAEVRHRLLGVGHRVGDEVQRLVPNGGDGRLDDPFNQSIGKRETALVVGKHAY